jgi:hypothetical protein
LLVKDFQNKRILKEVTGYQRNKLFFFGNYIEVLAKRGLKRSMYLSLIRLNFIHYTYAPKIKQIGKNNKK